MFSELAGLAIGNLFRARARLAMTAGGVVVGTSAVILLVALTFGLQRSAEAGIGNSSAVTEIQVYPSWEIPPGQSPEDMPQLNLGRGCGMPAGSAQESAGLGADHGEAPATRA